MYRTIIRAYSLGLLLVLTRLLLACGAAPSTLVESTLTSSPLVSGSVSPASVALSTGQGQSTQFTAAVSGTSNIAVTWSVNGIAAGSTTVGAVQFDRAVYLACGAHFTGRNRHSDKRSGLNQVRFQLSYPRHARPGHVHPEPSGSAVLFHLSHRRKCDHPVRCGHVLWPRDLVPAGSGGRRNLEHARGWDEGEHHLSHAGNYEVRERRPIRGFRSHLHDWRAACVSVAAGHCNYGSARSKHEPGHRVACPVSVSTGDECPSSRGGRPIWEPDLVLRHLKYPRGRVRYPFPHQAACEWAYEARHRKRCSQCSRQHGA